MIFTTDSTVSQHTFGPLADVLAEARSSIRVFFRNDDGAWADHRLMLLCECFREQEIPLDIAVIPAALTAESIRNIESVLTSAETLVHIHQHGFAHANHQREGRSCEFGPHRTAIQQQADIERGQELLQDAFGHRSEPIFTPPWNRCTTDTTLALKSLGFSCFSRIHGSEPIDSELPELPVSIDWLKKRNGTRLNTAQIVSYICNRFEVNDGIVGVMLHHEHMDEASRALLTQFITVLKNSPNVTFDSMLEIAYLQREML